jgi:hypothetical protein
MLYSFWQRGEETILKVSRKYILFIAIMYTFALQFAIMQSVSIFQYWDELYALMCIPLALMNYKGKFKIKKKNKYINNLLIALSLFMLIGILSNCVYHYQIGLAVMKDAFLNLKFFMGIATTYYLFRNFKIERYKYRIRSHAKFLIFVYFIFVIQNKVTHFFPVADMRFGINAEKIFFHHPTELASATFFLILMLMMSYANIRKDILFIAMAVVVVMLTLRFKAIATVLIFLYMYLIVVSGKKMKLIYFAPLIPFVGIVGGDEFYFYFLSENTMDMARGALSFVSLKIARNTFPIGTGFGTFASWTSGVYYSPVYQLYGISDVWGLSKDWPKLVSDAFWPMIIAQNGFIGLILYIYIIICLFKLVLQYSKIDKRLYLAGMGSLVYLLVSSIAESAFVNPLALPLAFVIGLTLCVYNQTERGID